MLTPLSIGNEKTANDDFRIGFKKSHFRAKVYLQLPTFFKIHPQTHDAFA